MQPAKLNLLAFFRLEADSTVLRPNINPASHFKPVLCYGDEEKRRKGGRKQLKQQAQGKK